MFTFSMLSVRSLLQLPGFMLVLFLTIPVTSHASDSSDLTFRDWARQRPNTITVTSGVIGGVTPLFGPRMVAGVTWVDKDGAIQYEHLQVLCDLNSGYSAKCGELADRLYHHKIEEIYIGAPDGLVLQRESGNKRHKNIATSDLVTVPPGVKRLIFANVYALGSKRQAISFVFDDKLTDRDLRWILLEDAVYRIYGWRDE